MINRLIQRYKLWVEKRNKTKLIKKRLIKYIEELQKLADELKNEADKYTLAERINALQLVIK